MALWPRMALWAGVGLCLALHSGLANAAEPPSSGRTFLRTYGTLGLGTGIRFNNPYRLGQVLGSDARSLSRSATFYDIGFGVLFGNSTGLQYGPALRYSEATEGIDQGVLTPQWSWAWGHGKTSLLGHVGVPVIVGPDQNAGLELGVTGLLKLRGGAGLFADLSASGYYGAATRQVSATFIPLLSGHVGLWFEWEAML